MRWPLLRNTFVPLALALVLFGASVAAQPLRPGIGAPSVDPPFPRPAGGGPATLPRFARIQNFSVVKLVPVFFGPFPGQAPMASDDECLPAPDAFATQKQQRWGLSFEVDAPAGSTILRVRICRVSGSDESCFYGRSFATATARATFVEVPPEALPDPASPHLPQLEYALYAESSNGMSALGRIRRKLAPLPTIELVRARSQGVEAGSGRRTTKATIKLGSASETALLTITPGEGIALFESEVLTAIRPPDPRQTLRPGGLALRKYELCDRRSLSADAFAAWKTGGYPTAVWARAPLVDGCQLAVVSPFVNAEYHATARGTIYEAPPCVSEAFAAGASPFHPRPGLGRGEAGSSPPADGSCREGEACTTVPRDCQSGFEVSGRIRCSGGVRECVPPEASFCRTCGGLCGGCQGDGCLSRDGIFGDNFCAPASVCQNFTHQCSPFVCQSQLRCWRPMTSPGVWPAPGRLSEAEACGVVPGSPCEPMCPAVANCGWDGCTGECGRRCPSDQRCLPIRDSLTGGICARSSAACARDSDCCPPEDPRCERIGGRRCVNGYCASGEFD
jgi:hypothetical protein